MPTLAARFAAKEAVMKALGVGLGAFGWADVEVVRAPGGAPDLVVTGRAAALASAAGRRRLAAVDHPHRDGRLGRGGGRRVIPVLTPAEMAEVDRKATEPVEVLIERAGSAVASAARRMLGGGYGRRVVVVAGRGNNGADGRVAAHLLSRRGAAVSVVEAADLHGGERLPAADLVIDAAYGTGLSRPYAPSGSGSGGGARRGHSLRPLGVDRPARSAPAERRRPRRAGVRWRGTGRADR